MNEEANCGRSQNSTRKGEGKQRQVFIGLVFIISTVGMLNAPIVHADDFFQAFQAQLTQDYTANDRLCDNGQVAKSIPATDDWLQAYDYCNGTTTDLTYDNNESAIMSALGQQMPSTTITYEAYLQNALYEENLVEQAFRDPGGSQEVYQQFLQAATDGAASEADTLSGGGTEEGIGGILNQISPTLGIGFDIGGETLDVINLPAKWEALNSDTLIDDLGSYLYDEGTSACGGAMSPMMDQGLSQLSSSIDWPTYFHNLCETYYNKIYSYPWPNSGECGGEAGCFSTYASGEQGLITPSFKQYAARGFASVIVFAIHEQLTIESSTSTTSQNNSLWGSIWGAVTGVGRGIAQAFTSIANVFTLPNGQKNDTEADIVGGLPSNVSTLVEPQSSQTKIISTSSSDIASASEPYAPVSSTNPALPANSTSSKQSPTIIPGQPIYSCNGINGNCPAGEQFTCNGPGTSPICVPTPVLSTMPLAITSKDVRCDVRPASNDASSSNVAGSSVTWNYADPVADFNIAYATLNTKSVADTKILRNGQVIKTNPPYEGFQDETVEAGNNYTYTGEVDYADGTTWETPPLQVAIPQNVCGTVPSVSISVAGGDKAAVSSFPPSVDVNLTTSGQGNYCFVTGDNDTTFLNNGTWEERGNFPAEPPLTDESFIVGRIPFSATAGLDLDPSSAELSHQDTMYGIICLTKAEYEQGVSGAWSLPLSDITSGNISATTLVTLLNSGGTIHAQSPGTIGGASGGASGSWNLPVFMSENYFMQMMNKFAPRAAAIEVTMSQALKETPTLDVQSLTPCQTNVARGSLLQLAASYTGNQTSGQRIAALLLSKSSSLNFDSDLILDPSVVLPRDFLTTCSDAESAYTDNNNASSAFYMPDTVTPGNYFIGLLFPDGEQVVSPVTVM